MKLKTHLLRNGFQPIPLHVNFFGHLEAVAIVNGTTITLIVDTGASGTVLDLEYSRELGFPLVVQDMQGGGVGNAKIDIYHLDVEDLIIGDFQINHPQIYAIDLSHARENLRQHGIESDVHGILGADILDHYQAVIDYSTKTLFLKSPGPNI